MSSIALVCMFFDSFLKIWRRIWALIVHQRLQMCIILSCGGPSWNGDFLAISLGLCVSYNTKHMFTAVRRLLSLHDMPPILLTCHRVKSAGSSCLAELKSGGVLCATLYMVLVFEWLSYEEGLRMFLVRFLLLAPACQINYICAVFKVTAEGKIGSN